MLIRISKEENIMDIKTGGPNLMVYKGYIGQVEFDLEAEIFHGEVINTRDVITFQGDSVAELRQAFIDSVEDYLEFCAQRGEKPEKPFSGRFVVRIDPELHRKAFQLAKQRRTSLNTIMREALEKELA
jgi:predicted HicB family RNase H-like nuclease